MLLRSIIRAVIIVTDTELYFNKNPNRNVCSKCGISQQNKQRVVDISEIMFHREVGNKRQIVGIITAHELNEEDLEDAVHRVHKYFHSKSIDQQNQLFEQRMAFLKGITKKLTTSGNAWLHFENAPNAHGRRKNKSSHNHHDDNNDNNDNNIESILGKQ